MPNNDPPVSFRIKSIYEEYYTKQSILAVQSLHKEADKFLNILNKQHSELLTDCQVFLDIFKLQNLVESYYLDVIKYKEYHFNINSEELNELNISPLSKDWLDYIHQKKNISQSKVASLKTK